MLMLLVVPLVAITGFPQWIPHFSALAFDDDDDDDDDLPWPALTLDFVGSDEIFT
jgi:hypothetical protein